MTKKISHIDITGHHVDQADFLVIDFETTGLSAERGDRVCEIGAVKLRGGAVIDSFGTLIDPERPISAGAYAVNGISPRMLIGAPTFAEIADKLRSSMDNSVLVAYNAPFDISFLRNELRLLGHRDFKNFVVDALAIARKLLPGLRRYPQESVARVVGIPFPVKHRALEDAMVTAKLFLLFSSILKAHDLPTVADLARGDIASVIEQRRLQILNEALKKEANLWIKYLSSEAEITDRVVTPKECVTGNASASYLFAYCHSAGAERNFRIDRILDIRMMPKDTI